MKSLGQICMWVMTKATLAGTGSASVLMCWQEAGQVAKGSVEAAQQAETGQPCGHAMSACCTSGHKPINANSDLSRSLCAAGDGIQLTPALLAPKQGPEGALGLLGLIWDDATF